MDQSSLEFIGCDELRNEISKCQDDINKRILMIDVRNGASYANSHFTLDYRNTALKTRMRSININPDLVKICTPKNIKDLLNDEDQKVFNLRRHASDVVIIERNTDDKQQLAEPKSKVSRIIKAFTRFDSPELKIPESVPIKILDGGYCEWAIKYPHFTTNPSPDPQLDARDGAATIASPSPPGPILSPPSAPLMPSAPPPQPQTQAPVPHPLLPAQLKPPPPAPPVAQVPQIPPKSPMMITSNNQPATIAGLRNGYTPSVMDSPRPTQGDVAVSPIKAKPNPGNAVRVTPNSLFVRQTLPRSNSSPNVAQADGDELEGSTDQLDQLALGRVGGGTRVRTISSTVNNNSNNNNNNSNTFNNNNTYGNNSGYASAFSKPIFDRTLKPAINREAINLFRSQIDFGLLPESSRKTITGLQNLGNTCFMNSVIQCLAYAPAMVAYFCSNTYYNHINFSAKDANRGKLAIEFGALVEKLNAHRYRSIEPKSFRDAVSKLIGFAGNEQQDSHEFMMMLFDKLHHDLNINAREAECKQNGNAPAAAADDDSNINIPRATLGYQFWKRHLAANKSIISDLFEGIFMSTLTCTFCKGQSNTFEVFNCLSLPISSGTTRCHLRDCLSHFSNPERIDAAWECPRCKEKREADKKIVICKLPRMLIIHLKRFSLDGRWRQKLQTTVDFPLADLSVDCTNVLPQSAYEPVGVKSTYQLCAVVNHYGNLDGGHYTAFCKLSDTQKWYTFDDSTVNEMKDADVCGQAAYILFYIAV